MTMARAPRRLCLAPIQPLILGRAKPPSSTWTIPALAEAYGCPTGLAGGGKIGIVELGGGWTQADVTQAFQAMGLPAPTITDVSVDGTQNTPGQSDADGEVALDIQVAGGVYSYCSAGQHQYFLGAGYWSGGRRRRRRGLHCLLDLMGH
jgi:hypothetical protein